MGDHLFLDYRFFPRASERTVLQKKGSANLTSSHLARNEGRVSKTGEKSDFPVLSATLSHEMRVECQKLRKNCVFDASRATLSHEIMV